MGKPHKAIKRRKRKNRTAPSKPKSPGRPLGKWVLLFGAIASVAVILGIYYYPKSGEKTTDEPLSPSVKRREPSAVQPKLTPQQEIAALKQEEMELARMVMKDFPDSEGALDLMGNLHSRHGRRTEAAEFWRRCLEKNPRRLNVYRNLATVAIDAGEFEDAVEHLRKAVEIDPKAPAIHEKIGHALVEIGRYDEAIEELEEEIRILPRSVTAHFMLGQAYLKQKAYKKAQSHYEKALELSPKYANACYGLARVFMRLKQPDKAKEYQAKFRTFGAEENQGVYKDRGVYAVADLHSARASAAQALLDAETLYRARKDFGRSEALLQRAVALDSNNSKCFERLGSLYNMTNRFSEAVRQFERMSQIEPSNPYCYLNIGKISIRLKQYDNARRAYLKAMKAAPQLSLGYRELARLYLTTNAALEEARELARKAVSLDASAESFFVLGWACDLNGDRAEASKAIQEALRLEPKNSKYRQIYERIKSGDR
ncbi:MAG: tetratricopeptide repeat protein [Phycisphaerae bacterium]|nr:tetratricopeptide repeat protein [Phycisphaerae bacterium]